MTRQQDDYKEWQDRYEDLDKEAWKNHDRKDGDPEKWDEEMERNHGENMRDATSLELQERREAREEWREKGDDNEGHDDRIDKLVDQEQLLQNKLAHQEGKYEYATSMREGNDELHRELEAENDAAQAAAFMDVSEEEGSEEEGLEEGSEEEESEEEEEGVDGGVDDYEDSGSDMDIESDDEEED